MKKNFNRTISILSIQIPRNLILIKDILLTYLQISKTTMKKLIRFNFESLKRNYYRFLNF